MPIVPKGLSKKRDSLQNPSASTDEVSFSNRRDSELDDIRLTVESATDNSEYLDEYEVNFAESIRTQIHKRGSAFSLSTSQEVVFNRIKAKLTRSGVL